MSREVIRFGTIVATNPILRPKLCRAADFSPPISLSSSTTSLFELYCLSVSSLVLEISFFFFLFFYFSIIYAFSVQHHLSTVNYAEIERAEPWPCLLGYLLACARLVNRGYKELRGILLEKYGLRLILHNEELVIASFSYFSIVIVLEQIGQIGE